MELQGAQEDLGISLSSPRRNHKTRPGSKGSVWTAVRGKLRLRASEHLTQGHQQELRDWNLGEDASLLFSKSPFGAGKLMQAPAHVFRQCWVQGNAWISCITKSGFQPLLPDCAPPSPLPVFLRPSDRCICGGCYLGKSTRRRACQSLLSDPLGVPFPTQTRP
uniref:Long intergenic non-protein coding RNA 2694 n=1 Tax=Nomascus leucogenys TaxID=61853 RepID=A0A2I3I0F1_NOMLE